jgi:hypothetical protein
VNLRIFGSAGVLLFVLLGCASGGWKSESTTAADADVAAYTSFAWLPASAGAGGADEAPVSIADANLRSAIRTQLVEKGYREVEANPDFRIGFETATRLKEKVSPPVRVGVGVGTWGGHVGGGVDASVPVGSGDVKTTGETQITIRAVDPKTNREVWLGTTTGEVEEGLDASVVEKAVADVLDGFPARRP